MALTVDLLETFINSLSLSGTISAFSNDGTNTTITVSNTFHARYNMTISIDMSDYTIISVNHTTSQIVVSGVIASPSVYTVPNPFYFHGTPYATGAHINYLDDSSKVPMIYLLEVVRETQQSLDSNIGREAELNLHFLDVANFEDWTTDDHYTKVITGLNKLVDYFILQAQSYSSFYLFDTTFERINRVKWGEYSTNRGHINSIFDERLSGVEVNFTLPIRKSCS